MLQGCYVTHTYDTVREAPEAGDIESLNVDVAVVAGEVRIGRAGGDRLYDLDLRFCESHFTPRIARASIWISAATLRSTSFSTSGPGGITRNWAACICRASTWRPAAVA
jgi:hypothetical protein